ncbi:hypothetical protein BH23ACT1_BH23ACT1_04480 [soil metagenome]
MAPRTWIVALVVLALTAASCSVGEVSEGAMERRREATTTAPPPVRNVSSYTGLGAWIDVFDYAPAYQDPCELPSVSPETVDQLVGYGV